MTAVEIIEEIKRLPAEERKRVLEFARGAANPRQLTPKELGALAKRMVETPNTAEADRLQEEVVRGFYGNKTGAKDSPR
ncbi:MAG: hypothetical protein C5B50_16465 [Verrucomicrobia bacterium]|nr:MAG: hypothetical protein C5B50_16465 [Verrucomicrobiota bacterium]